MTSLSTNNEDKDSWLWKIELKREEPEGINKDERIKKVMEVVMMMLDNRTSSVEAPPACG